MSSQAAAPSGVPPSLSEHLQVVTEALAATRTQNDVFGIVLTPALQALNAIAGAILLVDETGQRLDLAATQGYEEGAQTIWQDGPLDDSVPAGDALARREPLFFEHQGTLVQAYPELEARSGRIAAVATAVLPMFLDGRPLGTLILDFKEPHHFTPAEIRFLRTLAAQCSVALDRIRLSQTLEQRVQERTAELEVERVALAAFARFTEASTHLTDPQTFAHEAGIVLRDLLNVHVAYSELEDGRWKGRVFFEATPLSVVKAAEVGFPTDLPSFARPFETQDVVFVDRWDGEHEGAPTTGVYTAAALYPYFRDGLPMGLLTMGSLQATAWTERERSVFQSVGRSLALAFERAEHARQGETNARALDAFVAFSEAIGTEIDEIRLAQRAVDVLQLRFANCSGGYYRREGNLWTLQTWTSDLNERSEFLAALRAGLPSDTPFIAALLRERAPTFTERWDAQHERIEASEMYGTVGAYPVIVGGEVQGFFVVGLKDTAHWAERDRAIFRSVGRGLDLALERVEQTRHLAAQNATLGAFAELSRDLTVQSDPYALVARAQEVMLSLLPEGFALYYVPEGKRWHVKAQVGHMRHPELQATVDAGLPFATTTNLLEPWTTGQPFYQGSYDQDTDQLGELVNEVGATATLPIWVEGKPVGVLAVVLFGRHRWSATDQVMLETTARSLGLALERAQGVARLAQRTQELERSNAELEQFAYIASHDLQAPIRAVTSFAGVINKRYGESLDERGRLYLQQIVEGGEHMKRLVDDLLTFSRVHTEQRPLLPTDAATVFDVVASRLQTPETIITRSPLPVVQADIQQLDQLLQNLISNGLKYRRADVTPEVQVSAEQDGEFWRFTVADNGIGIERQYFERIFVIFQRLHGQETYEGTGIGLAVCKKIVERHGGRIWLESVPGRGTTFHFTLPEG